MKFYSMEQKVRQCHTYIWCVWKPAEISELKACFGLVLNMTINDRPGIKDYFSQKWIDCMPFYGDIESRSDTLDIACEFLVSQETPLQLVHQKLEML